MPIIPRDKLGELFAYMGGIARNHGVTLLAVGGISDHVHVLLRVSADQSLATIVRDLKSNSSRWMRETVPQFSWQKGYAGFSVSPSKKLAVMRYIARQEEHHRRKSFDEEIVELLQAAGVEYDPRFVLG